MLSFCLGDESHKFALLLHVVSAEKDRLYARFVEDYSWAEEEDREVLDHLRRELPAMARERGATALVEWFTGTLSNAIQITDGQPVEVSPDIPQLLECLYARYVLDQPDREQSD